MSPSAGTVEVRRIKALVRADMEAVVLGEARGDILRLDTPAEAITTACTYAGLNAYAATYLTDHPTDDDLALAFTVGEHIAYGTFTDGDHAYWTDNGPDSSIPWPDGEGGRLRMVRNWIDDAIDNFWPVIHFLREPYDAWLDADRAIFEVTVAAWWDARITEGHTADSARFLLSLTASPTLVGALTFSDGDDAPTLPPIR